ncbi:MAG: PDZ domain-containing protein [Armatimonadetes bacterium]|nr:PDZ domain-containing protein [Armatimonadota bacterium]
MRILATLLLAGLALLIRVPGEAKRRPQAEDPVVVALRQPLATGILVIDVAPGSPADKAHIALGDIIASYNERDVPTLQQLEQSLRDSRNLREVSAVVYRGKEAFQATLSTDPLGIEGRAVVKGKGSEPFHRPTRSQPDYGVLAQEGDAWREFFLGRSKVGYSREQWKPEGELLHLESYLRATGAGQDVDLLITGTFRRAEVLDLQSLKVERNGTLFAEGRRQGEEWIGKVGDREVRLRLSATVLPNLALGTMARILPQKRGTCIHFTRLEETEMRLVRGCELYCAGEDTLALPRGTLRASRFEQYRYGELGYTYWVDRDRRLVRAHYGGPSDQLCSREQALSGLPAALRRE